MKKSSFIYQATYQHKPVVFAIIRDSVYISTESLSLIFGQPFYPDFRCKTILPYGSFYPSALPFELTVTYSGVDTHQFIWWLYYTQSSDQGLHFPTTASGRTFSSFNHITGKMELEHAYPFNKCNLEGCTQGLVPLSNLKDISSLTISDNPQDLINTVVPSKSSTESFAYQSVDNSSVRLKEPHVRFTEAINYLKRNGYAKTQNHLATILECHPTTISGLKHGHNIITESFLERLTALAPEINTDYILTGQGQLIIPATDSAAELMAEPDTECRGLRAESRSRSVEAPAKPSKDTETDFTAIEFHPLVLPIQFNFTFTI